MGKGSVITSSFTNTLKASGVSDTVTISRSEYESLLTRLDVLQATADRCADFDLEHVNSCGSLQDATHLEQAYNSAWFRDAPYSDTRLREIADSLINACSSYLPSNPVWLRASQGIYPMPDLFTSNNVNVPNTDKLSDKLKANA